MSDAYFAGRSAENAERDQRFIRRVLAREASEGISSIFGFF